MLSGKRILVTGVLTRESIAFAVAQHAQEQGAEIVLTSFSRAARMTRRTAKRLNDPVDVLELDVTKEDDLLRVSEEIRGRWGGIDGALHAVAYAPTEALGGDFLSVSTKVALATFEVSAISYKSLAGALMPLMRVNGGGSLVGLDFDASVAWPRYDWMGVAKAGLEGINRYLARDLGRYNIRANLVAAGPVRTLAARGIPGFEDQTRQWAERAPLGWDASDPTPVAEAVCFLLSDAGRGITGEILHVDGGAHAVAASSGRTATPERDPVVGPV